MGEQKLVQMVHMIKMATMPIHGKNLKNLLWNRKADDLET